MSHSHSKRNPSLDLLRVIAALGVLLAHWTWSPEWVEVNFQRLPSEVFGDLTQLTRYGFLGVPIFFMISGAVVIRSAINKTPIQFLKARAIRIFPLYYVAILISATMKVIDSVEPINVVIKDSLYSALLIVPIKGANWLNPVFWTLSIEMKFYLLVVFALLIAKVIKVKERHIPLALSILFLTPQMVPIPVISRLELTGYLPFFLIGILASTLQSGRARYLAVPVIIALSVLGTRSLMDTSDMSGRSATIVLLFVISAATFLVGSYWISRLRMLRSQRLNVLGLMTYPIYLLHVEPARLCVGYFLKSGIHPVFSFSLAFLALVCMSYFLTIYFEPLFGKLLNSNKFLGHFSR